MNSDFVHTPSLRKYLEDLPNGLHSYPECKFAAEPHYTATERLREEHFNVYKAIMGSEMAPTSAWVPDVCAVSCSLAARDLLYDSDEAFHAWMGATVREVFGSGIYRPLFKVLSPSLVVMGMAHRWGKVRQGSSLVSLSQGVDGGRRTSLLELEMPEHLFPPFILESFARRLEVTIELSRANNSEARIRSMNSTGAKFELSWE